MMFSDASPSECCWYYIALAVDPYLAPVPPIVQEVVGGDADAALRFFGAGDWAKEWGLPLWLAWANADEWATVAMWWRVARQRREGRFLSLAEINAGWDGGGDGN